MVVEGGVTRDYRGGGVVRAMVGLGGYGYATMTMENSSLNM